MSFLTVLAGSKIAVGALTFGTLAAGGTAAVAYAGGLPSSLQQGAHSFIGAPAPTDESTDMTTASETTAATDEAKPSPSATPVGPDATGPAAFGLCNAYTHGGLAVSSTAYASLLATAALKADSTTTTNSATATDSATITAYCDTITKPGQSAAHGPSGVDAKVNGKSESHGSADDANASSDTSTQAEVKTALQLPAQVGVGNSHKPAKAGRP